MTDTQTAPIRPDIDDGDHDRFAHWVRGTDAQVTQAIVDGVPVLALCGKRWIPSRDARRYPVCPTCTEIKQMEQGL